ncbi:MAG: glutathione S-transferase family protein [Gluconacetobacter diazotrophicus]|nr:glutathione S-transferase family protein [Gluconacetobacter diazotrophicus]
MGKLVDGVWEADRGFPTGKTGAFERTETRFRDRITADGSSGFAPDPGRYRLYVSLACPWAHRCLIVRALKGLADTIAVSVVNPIMGEDGWSFAPDRAVVPDPEGARFLRDVYLRAEPRCSGSVTVPVLWDTRRRTIVSNESSEIIAMLDAAFPGGPALAPAALADEMRAIDERVYPGLNNGVYRAGFARTQAAYDAVVRDVFATLDWLEDRLGDGRPFLSGNAMTLSDIRLFTTLVRFEPVYAGHFKCNLRRLRDYPALWRFTRRMFQWPGIADTVDLDHIKRHYYGSHPTINPTGIVPAGPEIDYREPV